MNGMTPEQRSGGRVYARAVALVACVVAPIALIALPACRDQDEGKQRAATEARDDAAAHDAAAARDDAAAQGELPDPMARRSEDRVFRLGPNLLLAHVERGGGLLVNAGSAGFLKYLRFGLPALRWSLRQERDGVRVAVPDRLAAVEVPVTAAQAAARVLYLRVHAPAAGRIGVKINGRKAGGAKLVAGWQTVAMPVEEGRLAPGESFVTFEIAGMRRGKEPAIEWLQIGGAAPPEGSARDAAGDQSGTAVGPVRYLPGEDTLVLARDAGLVYHVHVPETGHLVADVAGAGCRVEVRVRSAEDVVEGVLQGAGARLDLAPVAGQIARLELGLGRGAGDCAAVRLASAALTVARVDDEPRGGASPRHVVLWNMSGLRADRVRPFAPWARPEVPGFERLAAAGTVFDPFWVQAAVPEASRWSLAHARYPVPTKALGRQRIPLVSLGEEMRDAGFTPIGVTAGGAPAAGLEQTVGQGFAAWEAVEGKQDGLGDDGDVPAPGADVLARALALFGERRAKERLFLLVQTADTRLPWVGHEPWLGRYDPGDYDGPFERVVRAEDVGAAAGDVPAVSCEQTPAPRDLARLRAIYDAAVSYQDALLVQFLDQLAQWGELDRTMVIVTSDGGMGLWEDGRCGPETWLRAPALRVPLLVHYPPSFPAGRVAARGAEAIDLLPTLLRALGLPVPALAQGIPLLGPAQEAASGYPRPLLASHDVRAHAMRLAGWTIHVGTSGVPAIYHVKADRREQSNLAAARPIERRFLTDVLSLLLPYRHEWNQRAWGTAANMSAEGLRRIEGGAP